MSNLNSNIVLLFGVLKRGYYSFGNCKGYLHVTFVIAVKYHLTRMLIIYLSFG